MFSNLVIDKQTCLQLRKQCSSFCRIPILGQIFQGVVISLRFDWANQGKLKTEIVFIVALKIKLSPQNVAVVYLAVLTCASFKKNPGPLGLLQ